MTARVDSALAPHGLVVVGAFHPEPGDGAPSDVATLALVGAAGPAMWRAFTAAPEHGDGVPDPLDRWSRRVIGEVAGAFGAEALFPFGGPPYQPFLRWAERGEGARPSPLGMQVSAARGLWVSYRGALAFSGRLEIAAPDRTDPCAGCPAPCLRACPVGAFSGEGYDVPRCVAHLKSPAGAPCLGGGCLARRACPIARGAMPPAAQRGFHMAAFLRARLAAGD